MANLKPATETPLPWSRAPGNPSAIIDADLGRDVAICCGKAKCPQNAAYIVRAANAYPELVEALRACFGGSLDASVKAEHLLRKLGEA